MEGNDAGGWASTVVNSERLAVSSGTRVEEDGEAVSLPALLLAGGISQTTLLSLEGEKADKTLGRLDFSSPLAERSVRGDSVDFSSVMSTIVAWLTSLSAALHCCNSRCVLRL